MINCNPNPLRFLNVLLPQMHHRQLSRYTPALPLSHNLSRYMYFVVLKVQDCILTSAKLNCQIRYVLFELKVWHLRKWIAERHNV